MDISTCTPFLTFYMHKKGFNESDFKICGCQSNQKWDKISCMLETPFSVIRLVKDALNLWSPVKSTLLPCYAHSQSEVRSVLYNFIYKVSVIINGINDSCIV